MERRGDCTLTTCPVPDGFFSSPPSTAGSAFFLAAFGILIPVNLYTGMRYKTPLYSSAIIAGLAFEAMGYIGRILLHSDTASSSYFALYTMGVNMGPTCLTAAIFLTLPRIIVLYGSQFTIISQPLYLAVFFLAFGTFALAFEASGSAFAATGVGPAEMGQGADILIAGLAMQGVSIAMFYAGYWYFAYRLRHRRHVLDPRYSKVYCSVKFSVFVLCMQLTAAFLLIRTAIRIVAIAGGLDGAISQSEIVAMMLDGCLVLFSCLILTIIPAGAVFGPVWQSTSPFNSGDEDDDLPLHNQQGRQQPRTRQLRKQQPPTYQQGRQHPPNHHRSISPPFPTIVPDSYQPRLPPYRPAGPPPIPPRQMPASSRPPYAISPPKKVPFLHASQCSTPTTPGQRAQATIMVNADSLW